MRAHFRTLLASSVIIVVALVACWPSAGTALALIPLLPETTSGTAELDASFLSGGGGVTLHSGDDSIFVSGSPLGSPFTSRGPTSAFISYPFIDNLHVSVTHAGQHYSTCVSVPPCANSFEFFLIMATQEPAPPPSLTPAQLTVPGTFGLRVSARVFLTDPTRNFMFDLFERSGPASITLQTASVPGGWLFESGFAEIDPTPEPTTLLLFGTTGAGLGLVRWFRRGRHHAA
jgi:PEP-CTERM motif